MDKYHYNNSKEDFQRKRSLLFLPSILYSKTRNRNLISVFSISIIIAFGTIVAASLPLLNISWAQQNAATGTNTTVNGPSNNTTTKPSPTDGYGTPEGHLTAIRHIFDDPSLRVQHYCKPNDKILLVCQTL